jgi:chaperone required for assembly of F1-ATPase
MKRFWQATQVAPVEAGFTVLLDGKRMRLPGGDELALPSATQAEAVAAEWQQLGMEFQLDDLPLTRLLATAHDRVAPDPGPMVEGLTKYAETDLLCYRAAESRLAARQAEQWQPLLDWAALQLDASLRITDSLMPVAQPPEALAALRAAVARHSPVELTALGLAVPALGSLVLGLALSAGRIDAATAHRLGALDELFQIEFWGEDAEATARLARLEADITMAARLLALARSA